MGIKNRISTVMNRFKVTVRKPEYIPVLSGSLLKDKVVFITGGSTGIGLEIAKRCIENEAKVFVASRNQDRNKEILSDRCITSIYLDIKNIEETQNTLAKFLGENHIDILINNAGMSRGDAFLDTKEEDYDDVVDTNLKGTYYISQVFAKYFIENGIKGNILNISSSSGYRPAISPYMISKWGINGLTEGMAKKLIKYGIVVNGIAPGPVSIGIMGLDGSNLEYSNAPAGRYTDPIEVANLAVFMVSNMGRMIVGHTVLISGGCANLTFDDILY